ncbi:MFS transporter [Mycobacterium adipatum]|jgi:MFS family permease|uniref:MFS transporter n=1 Tax=Mycobacterium adipatum TaxID=1682113 RepID=A0A172UT23_9MYCO|nr:MFS transporter [Mycobacterium adipatum]ANE82108.1 MFS transporter [Mycobacterium adipatum]MBI5738367.1 MFS transporter [Mycolicibacterium neoaurum]
MTDTDSRAPAGPAVPEGAGTPLALAALLSGTLVGTVSNNVVNVPMPAILAEFDAPLGSGVFVVVGFLMTFTATMPLVGWIGDRFGRRRMYCASMLATAVCAVGAATAPSLELLILWRCLGGAAASALGPAVLGLLTWLFAGERRGRAVGLWASVNGIGQAIGPTMGGFVADGWGWRWVFVPLVPVALAGFVGTLRHIPRHPGTRMRFDTVGAVALTLGSGLLILAVALIPAQGLSVAVGVAVVVSVAILVFFVRHCLRVPTPFVDVRLVAEARFVRSTLGAFAFMFSLGATLLAVPLYLVGSGRTGSLAGVVLLAIPASMVILGPLVGRYLDKIGARRVLRTGLSLLIFGQALLAVAVGQHLLERRWGLAGFVAILVLIGIGTALVQTPAATGATRSPAGAQGTGLGLFNLVRFGGSAMGAAWVAIALDLDTTIGFTLAFAMVCGVAVLGLAGSFIGPDPTPQR